MALRLSATGLPVFRRSVVHLASGAVPMLILPSVCCWWPSMAGFSRPRTTFEREHEQRTSLGQTWEHHWATPMICEVVEPHVVPWDLLARFGLCIAPHRRASFVCLETWCQRYNDGFY